jgi:hypothetical protein
MGGKKMEKLVRISIVLLSISLLCNLSAFAGHNGDPEIRDKTGDAFGYIDIESVWFYEEEERPEILFISMKINEPVYWHFQQTFGVFWKYNNKLYSCGLHLGFGLGENWEKYSAGHYPPNKNHDEYHYNLSGTYSLSDGIVTMEIPKEFLGNLKKDDVLTEIWSNAFRRVGFIGRIGFTRVIIDDIIFRVFGNSMWDYAPDNGLGYGKDYIIKY